MVLFEDPLVSSISTFALFAYIFAVYNINKSQKELNIISSLVLEINHLNIAVLPLELSNLTAFPFVCRNFLDLDLIFIVLHAMNIFKKNFLWNHLC